jgi:tetratricopeptide (TPR) repeat protein
LSDLDDFWERPDVHEFVDRAKAAIDANDAEAELRVWDDLVAKFPDAFAAWSARGLCLEKLQRWEDALASFRRSTALHANYPDHYNAATMLLNLGRDAEALVELDASLALDETYAEAWCNRGIALTKLGRHDEAATSFERAETADPELSNAFRCHAILLHQMGERDQAAKLRQRVAELEPNRASSHLEYAQALVDAHDDHFVHWEPGSLEDQIVDILERGLALPCNPEQRRYAWAEKLRRLQRIAHGRQATRRAGRDIDDASAIARFRTEAEAAAKLFPDDAYFAEKLGDARSLTG